MLLYVSTVSATRGLQQQSFNITAEKLNEVKSLNIGDLGQK
jgi:hypothetical protein